MKKVIITKFVTFDNKEFDSEKEAKKHLVTLETNLLTSLSHKVEAVEKYKNSSAFILNNLDNFVLLKQIQNDMLLIVNLENEDK